MISESALSIYLWGAYIWFVIGVVMIAIPAIQELWGILHNK